MRSAVQDEVARPLILDLLERRNWFDPKRLEKVGETLESAKPGTLAEVALIQAGFLSEQEVVGVYADDLFLPTIQSNVEVGAVDKEIGGLLPEKLCTDRLICPVAVRDEVLDVAFVSPEGFGLIDELQLLTGLRINPIIAPVSVVESRLDLLYRSTRDTKAIGAGTEDFGDQEGAEENDNDNILDLAAVPPSDANGRIVRMVNQILEQALRNRASDIHLEPFEEGCKFRLRIDGQLHELPPPSKIRVRDDHLPVEDPARDGHRRETHSPGRCHRAADRRQAHRPPRQHGPHRPWREDGHADPGQGSDPARPDEARAWTSGSRRT